MAIFALEPPPAPLLAPYAHLDAESVQCAASAARYYQVPELLLHAIVLKENGRVGQTVRNRNGSLDMGLGQINTVWLRHFAPYGVTAERLTNDRCTNLYAASYVLRLNANQFGGRDWFRAAMAYNVGVAGLRDPRRYRIGYTYATSVIKRWQSLHARVFGSSGVSHRHPSKTLGPSTRSPSLYDPAKSPMQESSMKSRNSKFNLKPLAAVVLSLLLAGPAFAGTIDTSDAFYTFYKTVDDWVNGALGTGLAITMLLLGAAVGVGKNSPMPALVGVAGAAFLHWGPQIIKSIMVSGATL